jgi:hypothetical protein
MAAAATRAQITPSSIHSALPVLSKGRYLGPSTELDLAMADVLGDYGLLSYDYVIHGAPRRKWAPSTQSCGQRMESTYAFHHADKRKELSGQSRPY